MHSDAGNDVLCMQARKACKAFDESLENLQRVMDSANEWLAGVASSQSGRVLTSRQERVSGEKAEHCMLIEDALHSITVAQQHAANLTLDLAVACQMPNLSQDSRANPPQQEENGQVVLPTSSQDNSAIVESM